MGILQERSFVGKETEKGYSSENVFQEEKYKGVQASKHFAFAYRGMSYLEQLAVVHLHDGHEADAHHLASLRDTPLR